MNVVGGQLVDHERAEADLLDREPGLVEVDGDGTGALRDPVVDLLVTAGGDQHPGVRGEIVVSELLVATQPLESESLPTTRSLLPRHHQASSRSPSRRSRQTSLICSETGDLRTRV